MRAPLLGELVEVRFASADQFRSGVAWHKPWTDYTRMSAMFRRKNAVLEIGEWWAKDLDGLKTDEGGLVED